MTAQPAVQLFYSVREVATMRGCSPEYIRRQILDGKLAAERTVGDKYRVRHDELQRYLGPGVLPGHDDVSSAPRRDDQVRRLQRLHAETQRLCAEMGKIIAELESA